MVFDIPLIIMISFLLCTGLIVCCSIRKFTTFRVYALGDRKFPTLSLVSTTLATYYGGATLIGTLTKFYMGPFWLSWRLVGIFVPFLMLSWLSLRISRFIYHISMPETIGRVYGKYPRIITALLACLQSIMLIATQIHILGKVISGCIHSVDPLFITILAMVLIVAYTIFGGVRAVVLTDIWQLITFVGLIGFFAWFIFAKTDCQIGQEFFIKNRWDDFWNGQPKGKAILRYLAFVFAFIEPAYMQHMYMASSPNQAKKVFLYAAIIGLIITLCCLVAGGLIAAWVPPDVKPNQILNYIMQHTSPLFKGLFCLSLLTLTMSTADSRLHICAVMISYDIISVLLPKWLRKNLSCRDHYKLTYIAVLIVAMSAVFLSLHSGYLATLRSMSNWFGRFYTPIIAAPFVLAVLGFHTASSIALIGMATGGLTVLAWRKWIYPILLTDSSTFPCVLVSGLSMLALHYLIGKAKAYRIKNKRNVSL